MPFGLSIVELIAMLGGLVVGLVLFAWLATILVKTVLRFEQERKGTSGGR